jgi:PmbA protein
MRTEIETTLEWARKLGADESDVILNEGNALSLSAQQGRIETYKVTSSRLIGVRVIRDHRVGISYSEDLSADSLRSMVESALRLTHAVEPDENQSITLGGAPVVDTNSKTYREDSTTLEEKIKLTLHLEDEIKRRDPRTQAVPYNGYAEGESHSFYGNHLGLRVYEREKSFNCYTSALLKNAEKQALFYRSSNGRTFSELSPENAIQETLRFTGTLLEAKPVPTGKYDVIFEPDCFQSLFSCFTGLFSAKAVKDGYSRFGNSIGETIAHPELTLRDLPRYEKGFHHILTDAEGVAKTDLTLIEGGRLVSLYHNTATARHFGVKTTGHASRSPKGQLGTSLTQLVIDPGTTPAERLASGNVLRIFALDGLHAGVNASSGAFSLAASGELLQDGVVVQGVKGITLSGNFFDLIRNVSGVGQTLLPTTGRGFFAPEIRFTGLQVAGH